jgi:FkbM family methyltransferase
MLIPFHRLPIIKPVSGILHLGAHECEERSGYISNLYCNDSNIVWIEAIPEKVNMIKSSVPSIKIFNECISENDGTAISFMVTNNFQSSSILNFKTHALEHPHVVETSRIPMITKTLKTFYYENGFSENKFNFYNLDIQGAELMALRGAGDILNNVDYIYSEININELYEGCALLPELDDYLSKFNFKRVITEMTPYGWGDAFYVKLV